VSLLALFHPPLPKRCVRLSTHTAFQCLLATRWHRTLWVVLSLTALRPFCTRHLSPFALYAAFLRALAGRHSSGYYGDSVALALAGCRRSRGTSSSHVRGRRRCPTHPLAWPHWPMSFPRRCTGTRFLPMHGSAAVVRRFFRRASHFTTGDWDSSNQAFTVSAGQTQPAVQRLPTAAPCPSMLLSRWSFDRG